jgi:hypothetical protein
MWEILQHSGWVTTLATSRGLYGLALVVHYSAVFVGVGTIVLLDLRLLGVADRNHACLRLPDNFGPGPGLGSGVPQFLVLDVRDQSLSYRWRPNSSP